MKQAVVKTNNRKFGIVMGACLIFIFTFQLIINRAAWFFMPILGVLLILMAFIRPAFLNTLRVAWMKLGNLLGNINTYLLLSIIFLLIITPLGLLLRLFRKIRLSRNWQVQRNSYWGEGNGFAEGSFDRQF